MKEFLDAFMTLRSNIYAREEASDSIGVDWIGSIDADEGRLTSVNVDTVRIGSSIIGVEGHQATTLMNAG